MENHASHNENPQRRRFPRHGATTPVFIEVQSSVPGIDDSIRIIKGQCIDLSEEGMKITTQTPLRPQAILRLFVMNDYREPVSLVGEVRWTNYQHGRFVAGFEVLSSENTDYSQWQSEVRGLAH